MMRRQTVVALVEVLVLGILCQRTTSHCDGCFKVYNKFSCPNEMDANSLKLTLKDSTDHPESILEVQCESKSQHLNATFLQGCTLSSVRHILFKHCPLPETPFREILEVMKIQADQVITLTFTNARQRSNLVLRPDHLTGLNDLKRLNFFKNLFTSLPSNILESTPNLEIFFFNSNNLETIPEALFAATPNLTEVALYDNGLGYLPDGLLSNLSRLTSLSLYQNQLVEIQPQLLAEVPSLKSLELSKNKISHLTSDVFDNMANLKKLLVDSNNIELLPEDLLYQCPNLEVFHVHFNRLTSLPATLFQQSKKIKEFYFYSNQLNHLPQGLFNGLHDMIKLKLKKNRLKSFPSDMFSDLTNLEILDLQSNLLEVLPPGSFKNLRKLEDLILYNNSLHELPENIFQNCESLKTLYLGHNNLTSLHASSLPHPVSVLQTLQLSHNNLSFTTHGLGYISLQEHFPVAFQESLVELKLDNNHITKIPRALTTEFPDLANLDLHSNSIDYVVSSDLIFKSHSVHINLKNNRIKGVSLENWSGREVKMLLSDNPLICDCHLYKFARFVQSDPVPEGPTTDQLKLEDVKNIKCTLDNGIVKSVVNVDTTTLTCPVHSCIAPCSCSIRPHDHMFIMDCSYQGLREIPGANSSIIRDLTGNYSLTLNLKHNNITSLAGLQNYPTLVNLTAADNKLSFINTSFLPSSLQVLDLRRNYLTSLQVSLLEFLNTTSVTFSLGENPWVCDCDLLPLLTFLRNPARNVTDVLTVVCNDFEIPLTKALEEDLCPLIQKPMVIVTITLITVFLFLFFVLGTVSVYRYQMEIKVWLFTHRLCLWAVAEEEQDFNKKFDAFISYSNKDEEYVNSVLVPGLESGDPKYRVCLHYRDWTPGEYIQNQIDQSIEASRRTIVVLSNNFIENVWGQIEFKTAHSKALKDKTNRIIVIIFGEVPSESQMDEELKLYLSTRTYLEWSDPKFWEKLRYAMPHPQHLVYKTQKNKTEKLELIQANSKSSIEC